MLHADGGGVNPSDTGSDLLGFGERLRKARERAGLKQEKLAERLGEEIASGKGTISNWENERSWPNVPKLLALSEALDVSVHWLVTGDGQPTAPSSGEGEMTAARMIRAMAEVVATALEEGRAYELLAEAPPKDDLSGVILDD